MKTLRNNFSTEQLGQTILSVLAVAATTGIFLLIGREKLGEAVIALLFLAPVSWSAARWGQGQGVFTAIVAALTFDFFFIPPFYTFTVGSLEGWLVLGIFLLVAIVVVGRIQVNLSKAKTSEREAILMYELSAALAGLRTQEAVAYTVARFLQQSYLAKLVRVAIQPKGHSTGIAAGEPQNGRLAEKPDRVLPILNNWGLVGEVQMWAGELELPSIESRLLRNFASQIGQAIERAQLTESETLLRPVLAKPEK